MDPVELRLCLESFIARLYTRLRTSPKRSIITIFFFFNLCCIIIVPSFDTKARFLLHFESPWCNNVCPHNFDSFLKMLNIQNVFQVDGIVAVITGGGTGKYPCLSK